MNIVGSFTSPSFILEWSFAASHIPCVSRRTDKKQASIFGQVGGSWKKQKSVYKTTICVYCPPAWLRAPDSNRVPGLWGRNATFAPPSRYQLCTHKWSEPNSTPQIWERKEFSLCRKKGKVRGELLPVNGLAQSALLIYIPSQESSVERKFRNDFSFDYNLL